MNVSKDQIVSIIIISKDRAEYLSDALDSLMPQRPYIKEILILDKSADRQHAAKIDRLAAKHKAKLFKRSPEQSTSELRNEGIALATSDFLSFLDDDDVLLPHCIISQLDQLQGSASLVFCNYVTVRHPDHPLRLQDILYKHSSLIRWRRWTAKLAFTSGPLTPQHNAFAFISAFIPIIHGAMFKKDCLEQIRFSDKMVFCEDMHFWSQFHKANIKMVFNPQVLAIYRIHDHNLSSNFSTIHNYSFYESLYRDGFVQGSVNRFMLTLKMLRFSARGSNMTDAIRASVFKNVLQSLYLLPLLVLVLPYFITLRIQNRLALRKRLL